jgi:hypothetical protein
MPRLLLFGFLIYRRFGYVETGTEEFIPCAAAQRWTRVPLHRHVKEIVGLDLNRNLSLRV